MLHIKIKFRKNHYFDKGYPAACALYDGTTTRISFETLENICKVLNCTPNEILISDDPQLQRMLMYTSKLNELQNTKKDTAL
ncbi:XRE family transcriptional regulator [Roseburia sp. 1XD42-69]|nr:XRE family transcriptional regulator [Roseburia sp. 1XD42-69]